MAHSQLNNGESSSQHDPENPQVTIYVGSNFTPILIHKKQLHEHTDFFKDALRKSLAEGKPNVIHLPDVGFDEFKYFKVWLYTGKVLSKAGVIPDPTILVKLFVLGTTFGILKLQNDVIHGICSFTMIAWWESLTCPTAMLATEEIDTLPSSTAIAYAYENTPEGSSLRKLLVHIFIKTADLDQHGPDLDTYHPKYLADIIKAMSRGAILRAGNVDLVADAPNYYQTVP